VADLVERVAALEAENAEWAARCHAKTLEIQRDEDDWRKITDKLERRLASIRAFVTDPERGAAWDSWRRYIADGGGASWPRDAFEALLSWIEEECDGAGD
jgi:hypothetical protein